MAHERGMADKEAGDSMREWGWINAWKNRDAMRCPYCGKIILPSGESGQFDFSEIEIPLWEEGEVIKLDVEVKAGTTSFGFSEFRDDQREWAEKETEREKWVWLCVGRRITDKDYPRKTWLFPLELLYELEDGLDRKSIPYDCEPLDVYELKWEQHGMWSLPYEHPLGKRTSE